MEEQFRREIAGLRELREPRLKQLQALGLHIAPFPSHQGALQTSGLPRPLPSLVGFTCRVTTASLFRPWPGQGGRSPLCCAAVLRGSNPPPASPWPDNTRLFFRLRGLSSSYLASLDTGSSFRVLSGDPGQSRGSERLSSLPTRLNRRQSLGVRALQVAARLAT